MFQQCFETSLFKSTVLAAESKPVEPKDDGKKKLKKTKSEISDVSEVSEAKPPEADKKSTL